MGSIQRNENKKKRNSEKNYFTENLKEK